jgi:hypothetical protein
MDTDTHPHSAAAAPIATGDLPAPLRGLPVPDLPRAGDLAADAAAIHDEIRALLAGGDARGECLLPRLLEAEVALRRFQDRVERAGPDHSARCTRLLVRDARRSIQQASDLVERTILARSAC